MTEQQILDLGPALANYLDRFLFCCDYTQTFAHLGTYCRGLLSDLKRKTAEPIALAAGTPVRTMQLFLTQHGWDQFKARNLFQKYIVGLLPGLPDDGLGTVGIIDESGHVKKGSKTPGVQRQHCGEVGKTENCIVTVHLAIARDRFKTLIDADLFLPVSWHNDRERCRAAGIPDEVVHRPKWKIALEQLDRAKTNGAVFDWLTFDEGYGASGGFLEGLGRQLYVGEVPRSWWCFARPNDARHPSRADNLVRHSGLFNQQPWREVRLERQTVGAQTWKYKAARVWASHDSTPRPQACWLIWLVNEQTGEEKYFVSNAAAEASVEQLIRVAFRRWNVEHAIRLAKQEIGLKHFEGQNYTALMRHLILCLLMMGFVAEQSARLRGEKSGGDGGAGMPRAERGVAAVVGAHARHKRDGIHLGGDPLPAETQPRCPRVTATSRPGFTPRRATEQASTQEETAPLPKMSLLRSHDPFPVALVA
jgi:SRSO17 transposase